MFCYSIPILTRLIFFAMFFVFLFMQGCASSSYTVPETLEPRIDNQLPFHAVLQSPDLHKGKFILVGGEVLQAQGLQEGTQLEVLQLPLDEWHQPMRERTASHGRFLALNKKFLDPATFPPQTRVTIVGEIMGSRIGPLDEMDYQYPMLEIKDLHIWETDLYESSQQHGPRWSIFGGGGTGTRTGGGIGIGIGF